VKDRIRDLILDYAHRKADAQPEELSVQSTDPWNLRIAFCLPGSGVFEIRNVAEEDVDTLLELGRRMSPATRDFFSPYPWDDPAQLPSALGSAIARSLARVDVCYLLLHDAAPAGEFFLWKAGGNPGSVKHGLQVPELGIGLADAYHGRGLGSLGVRILNVVAEHCAADAVELTTALNNEPGWRTYLSAGYDYVGDICNPTEVDVTAILTGEARPKHWRVERQMAYVITQGRRAAILDYLAAKRSLMKALFDASQH
jgi:hypothetical protein